MNAFWLLSTLLLWNVLCEVHGGAIAAESYGRKTVRVMLANCRVEGESRYPVLFESEETMTPTIGDENQIFDRTYKTPENCGVRCFTMKNTDGNFPTNEARVTLTRNGTDTTSVRVLVEPHGKPATYKIQMTGVCYKPIKIETTQLAANINAQPIAV